MKTRATLMMSDAVNLKNMRLDPGCMYSAVEANFARGLPQLMSHDRHRLAGWIVPSALHFVSGLTRVLGKLYLAESEEDQSTLLEFAARHMSSLLAEISESSKIDLQTILKDSLQGTESVWNIGAEALVEPGLAKRHFPDLFGQEDKDGLVPMSSLAMIRPGVFQIGDLCVFAHPFLRRSESSLNHFNVELLNALDDLKASNSVRVRLRLDPDMVGLAKTASDPIELDHWYGPKFSNDLSLIKPGVTVHGADDVQRRFHELSKTEFWWQRRKNDSIGHDELILEAEELRDTETGSKRDKFRCRYVHSVIDEPTKRIEHLDGSIRAYDAEQMLARVDQNIMHSGKQTEYTKLWRVDGNLELGIWKALMHFYFRSNPLVAEYFGETPEAEILQIVEEPQGVQPSETVDELVPWICEGSMDFQMMVTRHPRLEREPSTDREARPTLRAETPDGDIAVFDYRFQELRKILLKSNKAVEIPGNARFVLFHDEFLEMPMLMHRTREALEQTVDAYREHLAAVELTYPSASIVITLGLMFPDYTESFSVFGKVSDVSVCFQRKDVFPPSIGAEDWTRDSARQLQRFGSPSMRSLRFSGLSTGELLHKPQRTQVPGDAWTRVAEGFEVNGEKLPAEVEGALSSGGLSFTMAYNVMAATCSACGGSYFVCGCSELSDEAKPALDVKLAFLYWTPGEASATSDCEAIPGSEEIQI